MQYIFCNDIHVIYGHKKSRCMRLVPLLSLDTTK
nr:MAG TPA: hypothetical protein [Caudoviricetes sp.]